MTPCSYSELYDALMTANVKAILRLYFNENSCINTTRVLLEVFRTFGLAARPFAVRALIFSKAFMERAYREERIPQGEDEVRQWCTEPGVHSVGIGFATAEMPASRWPGHLVVRAGVHHLFGATIGQASRPARGIRLPDVVYLDDVPLAFWRGEGAAVANSPDGSLIRYEPDPANTGYLSSPAWALRPGIEEAAYREMLGLLRTCGLPKQHGQPGNLSLVSGAGSSKSASKLSVEGTGPDTKEGLHGGAA